LRSIETHLEAVVRDSRADVRHHFEQLLPDQQAQLAVDAWMIGLRALMLRKAKERLAALNVELVEEGAERACPLQLHERLLVGYLPEAGSVAVLVHETEGGGRHEEA
jgi:hypothetical protein